MYVAIITQTDMYSRPTASAFCPTHPTVNAQYKHTDPLKQNSMSTSYFFSTAYTLKAVCVTFT